MKPYSVVTKPIAGLALLIYSQLSSSAETLRPVAPPPGIGAGSILQMVLSLALVLGLIMLVAWVLKRMNLIQQGSSGLMKVLASVAVGQRERIVLVQVHDTYLVVGIGPGQIRTLHSFAKTDDFNLDDYVNHQPSPEHKQFANILSNVLKQRK